MGDVSSTPAPDVDMHDGEVEADGTAITGRELPFSEEGPDDPVKPRVKFLQYLQSPIVTLILGSGENETMLTAHQALLVQSAFFAEACAEFTDDGSVCPDMSMHCTQAWALSIFRLSTVEHETIMCGGRMAS